jgi:uncharacterized membrane protein YcaP (DUF421 family)
MRLMGKRQIGEMQPYEFIITLLIAEVACVPMSDVSIPLLYGIASILAIFILHQIINLIEQFGQMPKRIINGKPSIIIDENGINFKELSKNNMSIDELIESLRGADCFSLHQVNYAILETSGKLSVLKNEQATCDNIPILLINNGTILQYNLKQTPYSLEKINNLIAKIGIKNIKSILIFTLDPDGYFYLQTKHSPFIYSNVKNF